MPDQKHQLAAIMFTDLVGYTSLMGKDSSKALALVEMSKEIQLPLVEKHNGRWLKEMGDGVLVRFDSAIDSVQCAIEIQEMARAKLDGKLRIGIHSGDVTVKDNDVYGDGVNVASRLESIADPGGIYISESIEKAIRGQTHIQAKYLGEIKLKNVDYDVRTYALQGVGLPPPNLKVDKNLSGRFIAELQRRGVIRAGATYIVLSLLLILLLPYTRSLIDLPTWFTTVLYSTLIVGFPIALYLAWNYERSPEGFVRTNSKQSWQNPYSESQKKPLTGSIILIVMVFIIAFMYVQPRYLNKTRDRIGSRVKTNIRDKSIAVLPFANMSNDPEQEYFSDGMMEEILNHLFQIGDLLVTSRTSVMKFKGTTKSIPEIAKELGVSTILEGSVRKSGNRVRITVQLIDGYTDKHLWSESYDRDLDDIFSIQSEVAKTIAATLQAEIQPEVKLRIESQPTENLDAYNLLLETRGLSVYGEENKKALELLNTAIGLDPNFSMAYAVIGLRLQAGATFQAADGGMDPQKAKLISRPYIEKAISLDPDNGMAHQWLAYSLLWFDWDFNGAERGYNEVKRIYPNQSWIDFLIAKGEFEEALRGARHTMDIDPTNFQVWINLINASYFASKYQQTIAHINSALADSTGSLGYSTMSGISRIYMYLGRYKEALNMIDRIRIKQPNEESPRILAVETISHYHLGNGEKVASIIEKLKLHSMDNAGGSPSFYLAMAYAEMREIDTAFEWLDKAYTDHEVEMYWLKVEPPFKPLHSDPRWQEMLDKVGFPD